MSWLDAAWPVARAVLFRMDAERAHVWTVRGAEWFGGLAPSAPPDPALRREVAGVPFLGPVGLAAGLDKDGRGLALWPRLGFGFVEVGTVTAHPQPGNPLPRLFRYPEQAAIVNRMGFNNLGSAALADRLRAVRDRGGCPVPLGANVGKSKVTPLDEAPDDYATSIHRLRGLVDWFTVNVSSPNTPGLRSLQDRDALDALLPRAVDAAGGTPVFLKLAPDLEDEALAAAVGLAKQRGIAGIIATNTTIRRDLGFDPGEDGGLSGRPLWPHARAKIEVVVRAAGGLPVIGVGGIEDSDQVRELLALGCAAVQLYSSLVFRGPGLVARIHRELAGSNVGGQG